MRPLTRHPKGLHQQPLELCFLVLNRPQSRCLRHPISARKDCARNPTRCSCPPITSRLPQAGNIYGVRHSPRTQRIRHEADVNRACTLPVRRDGFESTCDARLLFRDLGQNQYLKSSTHSSALSDRRTGHLTGYTLDEAYSRGSYSSHSPPATF